MAPGTPPQVQVLSAIIPPRPTQSSPSALLPGTFLQSGEEGSKPRPLALPAGEPGLLPRVRAPRSQPGLASTPSRLLAQIASRWGCA